MLATVASASLNCVAGLRGGWLRAVSAMRSAHRAAPARALLICALAGTAIALRSAGDNPSVRQRHAPCVNEVRSVLGEVAIDDHRVSQLDVASFETATRQRSWRAGLAAPVDDVAGIVLHVDVKVRVGVAPF